MYGVLHLPLTKKMVPTRLEGLWLLTFLLLNQGWLYHTPELPPIATMKIRAVQVSQRKLSTDFVRKLSAISVASDVSCISGRSPWHHHHRPSEKFIAIIIFLSCWPTWSRLRWLRWSPPGLAWSRTSSALSCRCLFRKIVFFAIICWCDRIWTIAKGKTWSVIVLILIPGYHRAGS